MTIKPGWIVALALGLFWIWGCTLRLSPPNQTIRLAFPPSAKASNRDGPQLEEMNSFAIVAKGPVSNTLGSSQVGNRSLACLKLEGQVFYPYTLAQLSEGVGLTLPIGNFDFKIIAFSTGSSDIAPSIPQMLANNPNASQYVIGEGSGSTSTPRTVSLASTYVNVGATNLLVACPPQSVTLKAAVANSSNLIPLTRTTGSFATGVPISTPNDGGLKTSHFTDSGGTAHFVFASGGTTYYIAQGISPRVVYAGSNALARTSAIGVNAQNVLTVFADHDNAVAVFAPGFFTQNGNLFDWGGVSFTPISSGYANHQLRFGANGSAVIAAQTNVVGPVISVSGKVNGGVWEAISAINTAGVVGCASATQPKVRIDAQGYSHLAYTCLAANNHIGHATNRSGTWVTESVIGTSEAINAIDFDIDSNNDMHIFYAANSISRVTSAVGSDTWSTPSAIYTPGGSISSLQALTISPSSQHLLFVENTLGIASMNYYNNETGAFQFVNSIGFPTNTDLANGFNPY